MTETTETTEARETGKDERVRGAARGGIMMHYATGIAAMQNNSPSSAPMQPETTGPGTMMEPEILPQPLLQAYHTACIVSIFFYLLFPLFFSSIFADKRQ